MQLKDVLKSALQSESKDVSHPALMLQCQKLQCSPSISIALLNASFMKTRFQTWLSADKINGLLMLV